MRFALTRIDDARRGEPADNPHWRRFLYISTVPAMNKTTMLRHGPAGRIYPRAEVTLAFISAIIVTAALKKAVLEVL
jgi:hypothetical protein